MVPPSGCTSNAKPCDTETDRFDADEELNVDFKDNSVQKWLTWNLKSQQNAWVLMQGSMHHLWRDRQFADFQRRVYLPRLQTDTKCDGDDVDT